MASAAASAAATLAGAANAVSGGDSQDSGFSGIVMSAVITGIYLLFRYLDIRYIQKKDIVVKDLFREGVILFISVVSGSYIVNELSPAVEFTKKSPMVFTAEPEF